MSTSRLEQLRRRKRRSAIIKILSDMSRGGWAHSRFDDYRDLETELAVLEEGSAP